MDWAYLETITPNGTLVPDKTNPLQYKVEQLPPTDSYKLCGVSYMYPNLQAATDATNAFLGGGEPFTFPS